MRHYLTSVYVCVAECSFSGKWQDDYEGSGWVGDEEVR